MNAVRTTENPSKATSNGTDIKSKSDVVTKRHDQGFVSHTAARASVKRGFFKENGGTATATTAHSIKQSTGPSQLE